jgi:phage gp36-like protein
MPYCTAADVESYVGVLQLDQLVSNSDVGDAGITGDTGVGGAEANITMACTNQSSIIDGYLMGRYTTPITQPDNVLAVLKVHCLRLVVYQLFQSRLLSEKYTSIINDRDNTIKWLESIAANQQSIPSQDADVGASAHKSVIGGSQRQVFGNGDILGQIGNIDIYYPGM